MPPLRLFLAAAAELGPHGVDRVVYRARGSGAPRSAPARHDDSAREENPETRT